MESDRALSHARDGIPERSYGRHAGWFRTLRNLSPWHEHDARLPEGTVVHLPAMMTKPYHEHYIEGARLALSRDLHAPREERRELTAARGDRCQRARRPALPDPTRPATDTHRLQGVRGAASARGLLSQRARAVPNAASRMPATRASVVAGAPLASQP